MLPQWKLAKSSVPSTYIVVLDPGENVSETLRREFMEEALDSGTLGTVDKEIIEAQMKAFFMNGRVLYKARSINRGVSDGQPLLWYDKEFYLEVLG